MRFKTIVGLVAVLAVGATGLAASAQAAEPHWWVGGARLPFNGAKTAVVTKGTLTLVGPTFTVTCTVKDKGFIWNVALGEPGHDEITEFVNSACTANPPAACPTPEIIALRRGLPLGAGNAWPTVLEVDALGRVRDNISEIEIDLRCGGMAAGTFTGLLRPLFKNSTPSFAEFDSESGELENAEKVKATVTGTDTVEGSSGELVEVRRP